RTIPSTGTVSVGGADLGALDARRRARLVALLAQDSSTPAELTAAEVVEVGLARGLRSRAEPGVSKPIRRRPGFETRASRAPQPAGGALEHLGIRDLAHRRMGTLSGGQ